MITGLDSRQPVHTMIRLLLIALLSLPAAALADYQDAVQAYANGRYDEAYAEFKRLAGEGDAKSAYYVGLFHHNGFGVAKDDAEAAKWFRQAAERNETGGQYYMGLLSRDGRGLKKDPVAAHMWFTLSARTAPNERDAAYTMREVRKLERKMTPEQLANAKELEQAWKPAQ
jgi:TPR repeat protein